ncbi:MAG: glycosyltransferase, partial [Pseudolabrys sp.]
MAKKILYLVAEDWYFVSHRLPMARAARSAGYEVHVATRVVECAHQIENEGFALHPIAWQRGSINPLQMMAAAIAVRGLYRKLQPDIVHHVAFAPAIIGSLAALGLPMAKLNAL